MGYQLVRMAPTETLNGTVTVQEAVEAAIVPASALQVISWSGPVSAVRRRFATVPREMLAAAMLMGTLPDAAAITSG